MRGQYSEMGGWSAGLDHWPLTVEQVDGFNHGVINGPSEHSPFNLKSSHKLHLGKTLRYPNALGQVKTGLIPKNSAHSVLEFFLFERRNTHMFLNNPTELTRYVLEQMDKTEDPRTRQVMVGLVKHLHAFVTDVGLTEAEFHQACGLIAKLGQQSNASHNEVTLMAGSLGVSALVCLSNNGQGGTRSTTANLMGPFWRQDSPITRSGDSIVRSPTPGETVYVNAWVKDMQGLAVSNARVDVWHSSSKGFYENQDASQAEMNLRGRFETDIKGHIAFKTIKPAGYPIPINGLVGEVLAKLGRHHMRPAHLHFLIFKEGYKTQFSQVYSSDDPYLETDVQFGVTQALIGQYVLHQGEKDPSGVEGSNWWSLDFVFEVEAGTAYLPKPPISAKVLA